MNNSRSQTIVTGAPVVQEWGLINKYKGLQNEKIKQVEKQQQYEKMMNFRQGLNKQVQNKTDVKRLQKESDMAYYGYVVAKQREFAERQEKDRKQRAQKRKQIQMQNSKTTQQLLSQRSKIKDAGYHLTIGQQSEKQIKLRGQKGKQDMLKTLQVQLKYKNQQNKFKKIQDHYMNVSHQKNQQEQFDKHTIVKTKQYRQNSKIYNQYEQLLEEKRRKQLELERKLVDEAASQQLERENRRKSLNEKKKMDLSIQMKDTLAQQVKIYNYKKKEERMSNPEDSSFEFIGHVFRDSPPAYNKQKYFNELKKQAEDQKNLKKMQSFMSPQEYKLNRNQLNKIVSGQFVRQSYLDRSLGAIGENKRATSHLSQADDQNAAFIKSRLSGIKTKNEDYLSRLQNEKH